MCNGKKQQPEKEMRAGRAMVKKRERKKEKRIVLRTFIMSMFLKNLSLFG